MEKIKISLTQGSKKQESIIEIQTSPNCELRLLAQNEKDVEFKCNGSDLFECLSILRSQYLEKKGCLILCNGACFDAYPSRMTRQMGGGRKVYKTRMGHQARTSDLIDIFEPVSDLSLISTVDEQIEFHEKWLNSL